MREPLVYLMRGLPCCGKSTTARRLVERGGVVLETDEYFYACVGNDPARYDYRHDLLPRARQWNFDRFREAVAARARPIVVDRGNDLTTESRRYARHAVDHGYRVELREPESEWWREIRTLLEQRPASLQALYRWADRLAEGSRSTHRVPTSMIRRAIDSFTLDLTVERILSFGAESREPLAAMGEDWVVGDLSGQPGRREAAPNYSVGKPGLFR